MSHWHSRTRVLRALRGAGTGFGISGTNRVDALRRCGAVRLRLGLLSAFFGLGPSGLGRLGSPNLCTAPKTAFFVLSTSRPISAADMPVGHSSAMRLSTFSGIRGRGSLTRPYPRVARAARAGQSCKLLRGHRLECDETHWRNLATVAWRARAPSFCPPLVRRCASKRRGLRN